MFSPRHLAPLLQNYPTQTLWLGYSGGLDSHVLLHALTTLIQNALIPQARVQLRAIHINHGLSPHAATWTKHCAQVCQTLDIGFYPVEN